jgi:hypothetical protein
MCKAGLFFGEAHMSRLQGTTIEERRHNIPFGSKAERGDPATPTRTGLKPTKS